MAAQSRMERVAEIAEGWRRAEVFCIGDVMLDRFVDGRVERISPEAPIPVLHARTVASMPGGAGNVARNLGAIGAGSRLVGVVGDDQAAAELRSLLREGAGTKAALVGEAGRETTTKMRFVANGHHIVRVDWEARHPVSADTEDELISRAARAVRRCRAVVMSDYAKGVLTPRVCREVLCAARAAKRPVVVDPKGDFSRYAGADVVTPNRGELAAATGMPTGTDAEVEAACRVLAGRHGFGAVLATRSEQGLSLVRADGAASHVRAEAREVYDVSGAGDTVVAILAAAVAAGASLEDAAWIANLGGGIVVGKAGTAAVTAAELVRAAARVDGMAVQSKILSGTELREAVAAWRQGGARIGFTNGCFDLLHPGHLSLLDQARARCDRLVVAVNSDASVARLKGPSRPVQGEQARAAVLASLAAVDAVAVFGEDTPLALIRSLKPDVLVKGGDYTVDQVVGAAEVRAHGGEVVLADLMAEQSTTRLVDRMAGTRKEH